MLRKYASLVLLVASLLSVTASAHAQSRNGTEVLPVWDRQSGAVAALLVLEPLDSRADRPFSKAALDTSFGVTGSDQLGLVCGRGTPESIGNLLGNCLVASTGPNGRPQRTGVVGAAAERQNLRLGVGFSHRAEGLPMWLTPGSGQSRVALNTLTVLGERAVGREATVAVGGTLARARLLSPSEFGRAHDQWDVQALRIGARFGRFGANIVGRVVDAPSDRRWSGVDLGFTWRTPWSGQLSIGAENVVTRGKNPFSRPAGSEREAAVPYVRFQQDL